MGSIVIHEKAQLLSQYDSIGAPGGAICLVAIAVANAVVTAAWIRP